MDRVDKKTRSKVMAQIKKSNTKLEMKLRTLLADHGIRTYRCYLKNLPGSPDFAFSRQKVAIFIDSCFWHGCKTHLRIPQTNLNYWLKKFETNRARDKRQTAELRKLGWRVLRLWEHELRKPNGVIGKITRALKSQGAKLRSE